MTSYKQIAAVAAAVATLFGVALFTSWSYVSTNEHVFAYDTTGGKQISLANNPLLRNGPSIKLGYNVKHFSVSSEEVDFTFTRDTEGSCSNFEESLSWDSKEGVTMSVGYTLYGRVTDPHAFYMHFGQIENASATSGADCGIDTRIYQALRQSGGYIDVRMGELAESVGAEEIRKNPGKYKAQLLSDVKVYMKQFGFTITRVLFPEAFVYPGSDAIKQARQLIDGANNAVQSIERDEDKAKQIAAKVVAEANTSAEAIEGEANRRAIELRTSAAELSTRLAVSVAEIGQEATIALFEAELLAQLAQNGNLGDVYVTEEAPLGRLFADQPDLGRDTSQSN